MTPRHVIVFPRATPSNNQIMRMHWTRRKKENDDVYVLVRALLGPRVWRRDAPLFHCRLDITRYGNRLLDDDNLAGGFKFVIDALVKNRLIVDDSPDVILEKRFKQVKAKRADQKTLIEIYPLTP